MKWSKYSPEGIVSTLFLTGLLLVILLQVFGRLFMETPPIWTEELSRWFFVWMCFIGLGEVTRTNNQLKVDFLVERMPRTYNFLFNMGDLIIYFIITATILWYGLSSTAREMHSSTVTLPVPRGILFMSYPIGATIVLLRLIQKMKERIKRFTDEGETK
ncbi:MAG: TRAP transporter small permease [Vibrio sp.]|uniref:TRAP transporter small permease n=1 Tax=Vibrio sp. TaxID=678 RepID=UPI003A893C9A